MLLSFTSFLASSFSLADICNKNITSTYTRKFASELQRISNVSIIWCVSVCVCAHVYNYVHMYVCIHVFVDAFTYLGSQTVLNGPSEKEIQHQITIARTCMVSLYKTICCFTIAVNTKLQLNKLYMLYCSTVLSRA